MVDEPTQDTQESESHEPDPPTPPPAPTDAARHDLEDLERYRAAIRREMEEHHNATAAEMQQLREQLAQANEWIEKQKKAEEEREKNKGDETTLVVPPHQLAAPQHQETQAASHTDAQGASQRKKGLGWW